MVINRKNNESGMALVFAIGLLALMLAIGIAFIGNSVNMRKSAENNSARTQSRMLAMSAINRAVASLMVYTHSFALANERDFPEHYRNIYSYTATAGDTFTDGLLDKNDKKFLSLMRLPEDNSVVSEQVAMRHNVPFATGKWKGNWVFFRNGAGGTDDPIIGRAAWQVIGSSAQLLAPVFFRGSFEKVDPADDAFKPQDNRWGREIDEVFLTDTFAELVNTLSGGVDSKVIGYDTIYKALNTGTNLQKQRWAEKWFFPDPSEESTVGDPSMVSSESFASRYNGYGVSLMRFNISEFWQGGYAKKPGGDIERVSWQKAYDVGDNADQWYARLKIDTTKNEDLSKANSELAINRLTTDAQMVEGTFDYEIVTTANAEDEYSGLPFLRRIGTEPGTFADLATLRKQIAANFNDYCDSDGVPASDIAADTWVNDLLGKEPEVDAVTGDRKFRHPAFTGNEKTPYLYELGMNFSLVPNKTGVVKTLSTAKQDDGSYLIEADLKAAPIVKLCNIYPFDPEESSATGRLYQDFNTGDFMRAYVDFDEMAIKFKLRKITLKGVTFNYTVKTVDNSVSPAEENTFNRTLKCDMTVEWSGTGSEVDAADLVKEFSYYGKEWKRAGAADAVTGATEVEPLIFAADDLKNSSAEKPYPLKHSSAADDKSLQKLTAIAHTDTVTYPGMTINYTFDNVDHFFSTDSTGGLVYPLKDGVTLGNTAAGSTGTVTEFTVPESNSNKTKTISNFTMNVDTATLQVDAIRLTSVSLKPARMFLTANARMGSEFKERGVDYTGDLDPLEISGLTVDADFSAAADGAHPGFVVGAFRNSDPRQNLNKGDWSKDAAAVNAVADYAKPDPATEIPLVMKTTGANPDSPKYLVTETGKNMDNETVEEPAYKGAGSHISTAVIRNAPMMSPWEIGFIHRGVKWQTINLKNASIHSFDDNGSEWGKTAGASSYDGGDGGILEQIKMTDQVRTYGKINVNVLRPRHQDYCPEDMDIARVLFRNLRYGEDPWKFIANSTRDSSGKFPTAVASGAEVAYDTAAVNFLGDTARGEYNNRAHFLEYQNGDNALENAFGAVSTQETDASQEEIIGKTINLLNAAKSSPSIINVLVVAQSIRDKGGAQAAVALDEKAKYNSPDGSTLYIDDDDMIAHKECNIGRFDLYTHTENDDKNIYFDEITGEVKMFVTFLRDNTTGRMSVYKITYL